MLRRPIIGCPGRWTMDLGWCRFVRRRLRSVESDIERYGMGRQKNVTKASVPRIASLRRRRKRSSHERLPPLSIEKILAWADEYHGRTGRWPNPSSGRVQREPSTHWQGVDAALRNGRRGLAAGSSLARLLEEHRSVRNPCRLPPLSIEQILVWVDAHQERTGRWPRCRSGCVEGTFGETWLGISHALKRGRRGLPGGSSLSKLLAQYRGVRDLSAIPRLTIKRILKWADEHDRRTGKWPNTRSGAVQGAPGETWAAIDECLRHGGRRLEGCSSLARLLAEHRGVRNCNALPRFSVEQILLWADRHHRRTGQWPIARQEAVREAPGETWGGVDRALRRGLRGLA
jgi:hypothetical protein